MVVKRDGIARRDVVVGVPAALAALGIAGTVRAWANETINTGINVAWPGYSMIELAREQNLVPGYTINVTDFEDPLGGHAALAAGQIDVYGSTVEYEPLAVASGTEVSLICLLNPSYGVDQIMLAPNMTADKLPGKKIAAPQAYIGQLLMGVWLDSVGIKPDQVTWVNLNADEAVGPMLSGDLAAAYMYEPWTSKVTANLPGAKVVANSADPGLLKTGMFMDALWMNKTFIAKHRDAALAILKGRWEGLGYWSHHTAEANKAIAKFLQWPLADVESVIGTDGKSLKGGIYCFDFDESARIAGVLDGEPPFGIGNGSMDRISEMTNEWWVKLGVMKKKVDVAKGIDTSLMADLVKQGYRQSLTAHS